MEIHISNMMDPAVHGEDDLVVSCEYEVLEKSDINIEGIGTLETWHVKARSETVLGKYSNDFWFNESYGFVKMIYRNKRNETLEFQVLEHM